MKKVLAITSLAVLSTAASAFDYKINVEGRTDFINGNVKTTTTAGATTTEKYNNFSNGLIRLNLMGNINENLAYRFRYRFLSSAASPTTGTREASSQAVDYLYVDHKNQWFTTRFGKQNWVDAFGREAYVSGTDLFITSGVNNNYKSTTGNVSDYRYGVSAIFKVAETNIFTLALSNPNTSFSDNGGTEEKNTGLGMGAYYNGNFMNKLFQPTLGYTVTKQNGDVDNTTATSVTKDADNTLLSAGLRSEFSGFTIDADYKTFERENNRATAAVTVGNVKEETKSIYTSVAYDAGEFTPIAYYINDKFDSETNTADYKRNAYAFGTYWKPFNDVNFRYHAMFSNDIKKADGATSTVSKVTDKRFWLGFKADI